MKLSIIIPVFNEEKTVALVLEKVIGLQLEDIEKEIIVVDDGSTDNTNKELRTKNLGKTLKIIRLKKNQGKGAAVRTGIEHATGDYILIQDADLEYDPVDIDRLVGPIKKGNTFAVYGTRLQRLPNFKRDERTLRFFFHYIGNRCLSLLTSILYGQWITDMETGYKLFPRSVVKDIKLHAKSFDFEPEITAELLKRGYKIVEIPINTNPRGYEEGKKLNTFRDGIAALWTLLKHRFSSQ